MTTLQVCLKLLGPYSAVSRWRCINGLDSGHTCECVCVRMCMYSRNSRLCHAELSCAEAQASVGIRSGKGWRAEDAISRIGLKLETFPCCHFSKQRFNSHCIECWSARMNVIQSGNESAANVSFCNVLAMLDNLTSRWPGRYLQAFFEYKWCLSTKSKKMQREERRGWMNKERQTERHAISLTHNSCMVLSVAETELQRHMQ